MKRLLPSDTFTEQETMALGELGSVLRASHTFAKLMKYREEADYNPACMFTKEDFIEFRREAENLVSKINGYLKEKRYL